MLGYHDLPLATRMEQANKYLDAGCRQHGVTALMFRTAKFLFYIVTLAVTVYLIESASVEPTLAMAFAIMLISGPEAVETWLIHQGKIVNDGSADERNR